MPNTLKIYENEEFGKVRAVELEGTLVFVGKDVAEILGYSNARKALADHVDEEDKGVTKCDTLGGAQELTVINESGLYSLILSSKMPKAKAFKHWITSEVIPSIRKHGAYMTPQKIEEVLMNPDVIIELATELKNERLQRQALENKIEEEKPKVLFANAVSVSEDAILIGQLAKLLKQNGVNIGQNRLFSELRRKGYLIKRQGVDYNSPTQRAMEMGLFKVKETAITHSDGHVTISRTTKVTGKGQVYFVNMFLKKGKEETNEQS